jgi:hypothetical protein
MRFFYILVITIGICFPGFCSEKKHTPRMHALVLFDSEQSELQRSHKEDAAIMQKTFKGVARSIKASLRLKIVESQKFSIHKLRAWFKKVRASRDIAILYYSGAEGNDPQYTGSWPLVSLSDEGSVSAAVLAQLVQKKHPKLSFVFVDCYSKRFDIEPKLRIDLGKPVNKKNAPSFLSTHFCKTKGHLLACSHAARAVGYGLRKGELQRGSFTQAILCSFLKCTPDLYPESLQFEVSLSPLPSQKVIYNSSLKCSLSSLAIKGETL